MVRFKVYQLIIHQKALLQVSIPKWYDLKSPLQTEQVGRIKVSIPKWYDLKLVTANGKCRILMRFNSKMVRFKAVSPSASFRTKVLVSIPKWYDLKSKAESLRFVESGFNSKMVRFKVLCVRVLSLP